VYRVESASFSGVGRNGFAIGTVVRFTTAWPAPLDASDRVCGTG
jgi:hypothetical protein